MGSDPKPDPLPFTRRFVPILVAVRGASLFSSKAPLSYPNPNAAAPTGRSALVHYDRWASAQLAAMVSRQPSFLQRAVHLPLLPPLLQQLSLRQAPHPKFALAGFGPAAHTGIFVPVQVRFFLSGADEWIRTTGLARMKRSL